jgi:hypothetical protein
VQAVLGRGDDARLVRATEGVGVAGVRGRLAGGSGRAAGREGSGGDAGRGDTAADQAPPGEASRLPRLFLGRAGQDSTAAVSWDSGSASAFTAFASAWTSSSLRSS